MLACRGFHMGVLKAVRNTFHRTLDFDEAAGITPDFLPGPLPWSSTALLADWQGVGVWKKLLLQDRLRDCRAPKLLALLQISLGSLPRNSERSIPARRLQGCQLPVSPPCRKTRSKSLEALEMCNSLASPSARGCRKSALSWGPQSFWCFQFQVLT